MIEGWSYLGFLHANMENLPASIEMTLKRTFSTLCTGLHRSEALSYMRGSSPGVCKIEIHTFPSG